MPELDRRAEIKKVYSTESWRTKVDNMSDAQVTAIYLRFKAEGKLS